MMNIRLFLFQVFAVMVSCMMVNLSAASATNINIIHGGSTQATAEYNTGKLINTDIDIVRDPSDIAWTNIKIKLIINSASLSHAIKKIYIYKCKSLNPSACSQIKPEEYDNFAEIELSWSDISQRVGSSRYPEKANLMILVNLEGPYESNSWIGLMKSINRQDYRTFTVTDDDIDSVSVYAKSSDFIQPIKYYIENFAMIPFSWLERVVISDTSKIYAVGGSGTDLSSSPPKLTSAITETNQISTINKEFYLLFTESSNGMTSPVTLNLNPEFNCGNNQCELSIGESQANCCYDCGCDEGSFCDAGSLNPSTGLCKPLKDISLEVPAVNAQSTQCSSQETVNIEMRVRNAPDNLEDTAEATFAISGTPYSSSCTKTLSTYKCPVRISSLATCGQGTKTLEIKDIILTISYADGANMETRDLQVSSASLNWNYDCSCGSGLYCDIGTDQCESEDAISLGITSITSYLAQYKPGDQIEVTAKIFNPPSNTVLIGASAQLNLTNGQVSPGTPVCSQPTEEFEYSCSIPFSITNYNDALNYKFQPNTLIFQITYSDGGTKKTRTLSVSEGFYPISIPSKLCGDGKVDAGETSENCCQDVDCSGDEYCDAIGSCRDSDAVSLSIDAVNPTRLEDCLEEHEVEISGRINSMPTDLSIDYYSYILGGETMTQIQCTTPSVSGIFSCQIVVPDARDCPPSGKVFSGNSLELNVQFPDGTTTKALDLVKPFSDITLVPVFHCGDYGCESDLGENSSNCCIDCGCSEGEFCDYDPTDNPDGTCFDAGNIRLIVDSPTTPLVFDTCERTNRMNVKAHIENTPSNLRIEHVYATINNNDARILCKKEGNELNQTSLGFNCTIYVPKTPECHRGEVYTYTDNFISFFISYKDGESKKSLTKEIAATLPEIEMSQSYESLKDIIDESVSEMKSSLDRTLDIAQALLDWYMDCLEIAEALMWVGMIVTIGAAIYGGYKSGIFDSVEKATSNAGTGGQKQTWSGKDIGNFIQGTAKGVGSIVETWMKYCELASQKYELDLKIEKIKLEQIQMNLCIKTHQHQMDVGDCSGREESCFSGLASCVNFNDVEGWANELDETLQKSSRIGDEIGDSFSEMGKGFGLAADVLDSGQASKTIYLSARGSRSYSTGEKFCQYYRDSRGYCWGEKVYIDMYKGGCEYAFFTLGEWAPTNKMYPSTADFEVHFLTNDIGRGNIKPVYFYAYCYDSQDKFQKDAEDGSLETPYYPPLKIELYRTNYDRTEEIPKSEENCGCRSDFLSGSTTSQGPPAAPKINDFRDVVEKQDLITPQVVSDEETRLTNEPYIFMAKRTAISSSQDDYAGKCDIIIFPKRCQFGESCKIYIRNQDDTERDEVIISDCNQKSIGYSLVSTLCSPLNIFGFACKPHSSENYYDFIEAPIEDASTVA